MLIRCSVNISFCYELNFVLPKRYVEVITPNTSELDLIWK